MKYWRCIGGVLVCTCIGDWRGIGVYWRFEGYCEGVLVCIGD